MDDGRHVGRRAPLNFDLNVRQAIAEVGELHILENDIGDISVSRRRWVVCLNPAIGDLHGRTRPEVHFLHNGMGSHCLSYDLPVNRVDGGKG
ncbi:hypothetical protein D3C84_1047350 [compost metagenome]